MTRRDLLVRGGLALAAAAATRVWLAPPAARAAAAPGPPLLVVVFLRGGADGLHLVPPIGDAEYRRVRGPLAIGSPLPFSDGFGLHPLLAPLAELARRGELAAVHATGLEGSTRSHFEAQDRLELGAAHGVAATRGWLARALGGAAPDDPFARVALASALPLSLRGAAALAIGDPARFGLARDLRPTLAELYAGAGDDPVAQAGRAALGALDRFEAQVGRGTAERPERATRAGRRRPDPPFPERVRELLALERSGLPITAVALDALGWDTHRTQGAEQGSVTRPLRELGEGLAALAEGLRGRRRWLAVALTEFGRAVHPNGSGGTDHGSGAALLIAGPGVRAGVHGRWPGLRESDLHEGRDLAIANDVRQVLHEVLTVHLGAPPPADTFPGLAPTAIGVVA